MEYVDKNKENIDRQIVNRQIDRYIYRWIDKYRYELPRDRQGDRETLNTMQKPSLREVLHSRIFNQAKIPISGG